MDEKQNNQLAIIERENVQNGVIIQSQTTIKDSKVLFNLEDIECDFKLNDCKGKELTITNFLMKKITKSLDEKEIEIDEETGEVLKDKEIKVITILLDKDGKSYVTASKTFAFRFIKLMQMLTEEELQNGVNIKITERKVKDSPNKALSFELL